METKKINLFLTALICGLIFTGSCKKDNVATTGVSLSDNEISLLVDETFQLTATVSPEDAYDKTVIWSTSDNTIADVDEGLVTGISPGTATITVTTADEDYSATCTVTVTNSALGEITEIMNKGLITNYGSNSVDLACDANGIPYIAFQTYDAGLPESKAYVQVFNYSGSGTVWNKFSGQNAGICPSSYTDATVPSIAIKEDGTVFVSYVYYDDINDNRYAAQIISSFDGTNWVTLGGDGSTNNNCFITDGSEKLSGPSQMAFKQDGTLMIAMENYGDGYVNYFDNGGDWSNFDGNWTSYSGYKLDNSSFWTSNVNLATYGNKPYAYIRGLTGIRMQSGPETNGEIAEWEWLGSTWLLNDIGYGQNRDYETPLAISSAGEIYTCYQNAVSTVEAYVYVKHFDAIGNSWETIYTKSIDDQYPNEAEVVISDDILYLAVANYEDGIEIFKYDSENDSWSLEGKTPDFGATYYTIDLAPGNNGEFYIAYSVTDSGSDYEIGVFKYTPAE